MCVCVCVLCVCVCVCGCTCNVWYTQHVNKHHHQNHQHVYAYEPHKPAKNLKNGMPAAWAVSNSSIASCTVTLGPIGIPEEVTHHTSNKFAPAIPRI